LNTRCIQFYIHIKYLYSNILNSLHIILQDGDHKTVIDIELLRKDTLDNNDSEEGKGKSCASKEKMEEKEDKQDTNEESELLKKDLQKPFQKLQFLVRDWQNFDVEIEELDQIDKNSPNRTVYDGLRVEMLDYLSEVLRSRGLSDLQSTREQITRCFDSVDCYMV